jgi:hypothetical protein
VHLRTVSPAVSNALAGLVPPAAPRTGG